MSLKKYSELTDEQKKKVSVMYSTPTNMEMYLYNFDDNGNYHGRQYNPEEMTVHAESTVPDVVEKVVEKVKEIVKPKPKRTKKK